MTKSQLKMIPVLLWVSNVIVGCVEHIHAGPGHVIPTPLQRFVAAMLSPQMSLVEAQEVANWVWVGTGVVAIVLAISANIDIGTDRDKKIF
jgi:hypothetical protein